MAEAGVGGYHHFRAVDRAIRSGRPMPDGPAVHVLSLGMLVCLAIAAAYVISRMVG